MKTTDRTSLRSRTMRAVKDQDTKPELAIRSFLHRQGYRFRLHRKDLPGSPDLVFVSRRKVVFVNGCFWHGHTCARGARLPKTNRDYWRTKILQNVSRDRRSIASLRRSGWRVLVVWECWLRSPTDLGGRLRRFLAS